MMDPYVDTRSFEDLVNASTPDDAYDSIVDNIMRDRDSGWTHNYYKPTKNSTYDAEIARMNQEMNDLNTDVAVNEKLIQKIDDNIKNASITNKKIAVDRFNRATIKAEKGVETKWGEDYAEPDVSRKEFKGDLVEKWKSQRNTAENDMRIYRLRIKEIKELLPKLEWNRYLELSLESNIQRLRNQYVIDYNEEFLRKGITWACNYAAANRYTLVDVEVK